MYRGSSGIEARVERVEIDHRKDCFEASDLHIIEHMVILSIGRARKII
jgi:hypothetical protein